MADPDNKSKELLAKAIRDAKSKRHFFAFIVKGASDGKLIISKIKIKPNEVTEAKKEIGGTTILQGACFGEEGKLVFEVAEMPETPPVKLLKTIALRDSGVTVNPEFRQGKAPVRNGEGEEAESEQEVPSSQQHAPDVEQESQPTETSEDTVPQAPPPPEQADPQIAQLTAAMGKLGPSVQAAIKAKPDLKADLVGLVAEFQKQIKIPNVNAAKESLLTLGKKIKEAMQGNASQPPESSGAQGQVPEAPPTPDPMLAQLTAAMGKLTPLVQATVKSHPNSKNNLLAAVTRFQTAVSDGNVNEAKAALLGVNNLIKEISAASPPSNEEESTPSETEEPGPSGDLAAAWKQALAATEPQYLEALKTASGDLAGKMRASFAYATEQAEAGQFEKALAAFKRLEPMIAEALQGNASGEIEQGIVEKRKFMLTRFRDLMSQITADASVIRKAVGEKVPEEDPDELAGLIKDALTSFVETIQDEIDKAINAGSSSVLRGLKKRVTDSELMKKLTSNDLGVNVELQSKMHAALEEIEEKMAA